MSTPLVSICCVTYNHAPFIRKCLDGFLMQTTNFPIEILIHDDCSTDGTTEIIREYEAKYPDLIFPLYEEENQYSRGGAGKMDLYNYNRARGKYVAYCEGDDYWTDPQKLQKQVDFMEANLEYSVCFHAFQEYDVRSGKINTIKFSELQTMNDSKVDVTPEMYLSHSYWGQPLTMLFRVSMFNFSWRQQYKYYRDTHEIYHLLRAGKGMFMDFIGGEYIRHDGGIATSLSQRKSAHVAREIYFELYRNNSTDKAIKDIFLDALLWTYEATPKGEYYKACGKYFLYAPCIVLRALWIIGKRRIKQIVK